MEQASQETARGYLAALSPTYPAIVRWISFTCVSLQLPVPIHPWLTFSGARYWTYIVSPFRVPHYFRPFSMDMEDLSATTTC